MLGARQPRLVLVTRKTPWEVLLERHGTSAQARFYLETRGQSTHWAEEAHERFAAALARVLQGIPADRRRARVDRLDLDRFLFAPDDVVFAVGQDGLVANVAKYLRGQPVAGINPDPERHDGILCPHAPADVPVLLAWLDDGARLPAGAYRVQRRAMALAEREDGQRLLALNEVFVGHRTHQSARYRLRVTALSSQGGQAWSRHKGGDGTRDRGAEERQSSSGVICTTGTGSTGWARSIARQRAEPPALPDPEEPRLAWFVREPFPSVATGTNLEQGVLDADRALELSSEMGEDGVIFADGIEGDALEFVEGQSVRISLAAERLTLVVRSSPPKRPSSGGTSSMIPPTD
jgi:NAD kinase